MGTMFRQGYALVIGVGADLPNTIDDAQGLADILKDQGRCAYPPDQVQLLTGPAATCDAILAALDALAQRADEDAAVVVYFSGHGYRVSTSLDDVYFLMPHGYDLNRLKTTAIRGAEFAARLRAIPAKKLLVLLDCCHAGGVGEVKSPHIEALAKSPLPSEAVDLLHEGGGRVLIALSREDELSFAGKPYSAFTLALIEALSGVGVAKKDGAVRVSDLALHTRQVVPGRTKDRQHPILHFEHADNFVLAYYAGGDTQPKGLPFPVESIEIEPQPGAWRVGGDVHGDVVMGDKRTAFDQRGQTVRGAQTNIAGNVTGPVLSGQFDGPVAVDGGEAVDMRGSQGAVYKPTAPVRQHFGDSIRITGDGNVVGDNNWVHVEKSQTTGVTVDEFLRLLDELQARLEGSRLDPDLAEAAAEDVRAVAAQARKPRPNGVVIRAKLNSLLGMLATADGVWGISERVLPLVKQALEAAGQLF